MMLKTATTGRGCLARLMFQFPIHFLDSIIFTALYRYSLQVPTAFDVSRSRE